MKSKYKYKWNIKVNVDKLLLGKYYYLKVLKIKSKYVKYVFEDCFFYYCVFYLIIGLFVC